MVLDLMLTIVKTALIMHKLHHYSFGLIPSIIRVNVVHIKAYTTTYLSLSHIPNKISSPKITNITNTNFMIYYIVKFIPLVNKKRSDLTYSLLEIIITYV